MPVRLAYLGPAGTFTEAALRTLPEAAGAAAVPYATVAQALDAVRDGTADRAVVPLENSVEGTVTATLDELVAGRPLLVVGEVVLAVSFALLARPGTELAAVTSYAGHPHALPQCRRWLARHLPEARWQAVSSNAEAARQVAAGHYDAALAGAFAAEPYGLEVLAKDIHDVDGAMTRFVVVGPPGELPAPTGADRTCLMAYIAADRPGALLEVLTEFAVRGVNLTRIESRPTGEALGRYCFSVDCEGHVDDARVGEALMGLRRVCAGVRFLGSFPRRDGGTTRVRPGTSDLDFADAAAWLARLRRGRS